MYQLILFIHVLITIALVGLVLIQQGKGATIGASFGSGASQTVFGSQGSSAFLMKLTTCVALAFFSTCIILGYLASTQFKQSHGVQISQPAIPGTSTEAPQPVDKKGSRKE